ncbi:MAG: phosphopentomutase [Armatimonadetes bacterium]|nr:phosphopentomutase [Armatimonadota bacterium]
MNQTTPKRRFLLLVLDGCGAGALPDAHEFGEEPGTASTLTHVAQSVGGLHLPNLQALGLGNVCDMQGVSPKSDAASATGRLAEISRGKDTVTGHWEMMGVHTSVAFPTYPNGFPPEVLAAFNAITGRGILGNAPASGTEIIQRLGAEHLRTGNPIVYTSADSVFQVAAHEDPAIFGLERLYAVCEATRKMLTPPHNFGRVIARPFVGDSADNFKRTENRRDYPLVPPHDTVLDTLTQAGKHVHAVGKIGEIFGGRGVTTSDPTTNNPAHIAAILRALKGGGGDGDGANADFLFANLEDFDMLYGHRNDPVGFARLLTEFDAAVGQFTALLHPGDLLAITADHGNDPTTASTDHSREYAPLLLWGDAITAPMPLGDRKNFGDWGATVCDYLGVPLPALGTSFL